MPITIITLGSVVISIRQIISITKCIIISITIIIIIIIDPYWMFTFGGALFFIRLEKIVPKVWLQIRALSCNAKS